MFVAIYKRVRCLLHSEIKHTLLGFFAHVSGGYITQEVDLMHKHMWRLVGRRLNGILLVFRCECQDEHSVHRRLFYDEMLGL